MSDHKYSLITLVLTVLSIIYNSYKATLNAALLSSHPSSEKNGPPSARVCPKGSGPRSAAKQGGSLCVAPLNHGGPMSAPRSRGHVLQQNRAVLCV